MFYQLRNARLCAQVSDYGAKLTQLIVPNKDGERRDIVLGFATEEEWRTKETYFNAIIVSFRLPSSSIPDQSRRYHFSVLRSEFSTFLAHGRIPKP